MNEAIIIKTSAVFKSDALNKATAELAKCFNTANKSYKDACKVLAKLEDGKAYKEDGFSSLAEYAETIGLEKSAAHKMENAGRLLLSENETIRKFAEHADYSKCTLLASEDAEEVAAAIESGDIKPESTAKEIRNWKSSRVPKDGKEKIVPTWHIQGHAFSVTREADGGEDKARVCLVEIDVKVGIASPADWAREFDDTAIVSTAKDPDGDTIYMALTADGTMFNYHAERVKKADKPKAPAAPVAFDLSKLPDDVVKRMIEEYNAKHAQG